jgi:hypothetical protein
LPDQFILAVGDGLALVPDRGFLQKPLKQGGLDRQMVNG